ncbi:MAG TPA: hypothetical protein VGJ20_01615 [Xanthobacteraceae bacterium]
MAFQYGLQEMNGGEPVIQKDGASLTESTCSRRQTVQVIQVGRIETAILKKAHLPIRITFYEVGVAIAQGYGLSNETTLASRIIFSAIRIK